MTSQMSTPSSAGDRDRAARTSLAVYADERPSGCMTAATASNESPSQTLLGTGELARACHTTVRTVRFYEESGLVEPLDRKDGGHRLFRQGTEERLRLIMDLREAGLSLQEIKELFELKGQSRSAKEAARRMGDAIERRAEDLQAKIAVLRRLRDDLAAMAAVLHECEPCEATRFPERCPTCDVMARPDLPRAMRLLWSTTK